MAGQPTQGSPRIVKLPAGKHCQSMEEYVFGSTSFLNWEASVGWSSGG